MGGAIVLLSAKRARRAGKGGMPVTSTVSTVLAAVVAPCRRVGCP